MFEHISFKDNCIGCYSCVDVCPADSITIEHTSWNAGLADLNHYYKAILDVSSCIECELCAFECPTGNILIDGFSPSGNTGGNTNDPPKDGGSNDNQETQLPCKAMNSRSKEGTKFSKNLESLKSLINLPIEKGFLNYNGPEIKEPKLQDLFYTMDSDADGESVTSPLMGDKNVFGYLHTHRNLDHIASIHSKADIFAYITMVNTRVRNNYSYDNTYGIVVGSQGTYSLNITDISKFTIKKMKGEDFEKFINDFTKEYDKTWENVENYYTDTENFMSNLLSKFYDILGISLFKFDSKNNIWGKVSKGENNKPKYDFGCS